MPSKYKLSNAMTGITRRIDNINDWNTSDTTTKLLMEKFSELETARLEIDDRWDEFLGEDPSDVHVPPGTKFLHTPEGYKALVIERQEATNDMDAKMRACGKRILTRDRVSAPSTSAPPSTPRGPQFRLVSDMKPPTLTPSCSPPEMRDWVDRFREYAEVSNFSATSLKGQLGAMKACIAPEITLAIAEDLKSIEQIISAIETHFIALYPLFKRRYDVMFNFKKEGRTFKEYADELRKRAIEAELLGGLKFNELCVFLALAATQGETALFLKLKEVEDPTMKLLLAKAAAFENALVEARKPASSPINKVGETTHHVDETAAEVIAAMAPQNPKTPGKRNS